jgi:hypothetical protein
LRPVRAVEPAGKLKAGAAGAGFVIGGPVELLKLPVELFFQGRWSSSQTYEFPVLDWGISGWRFEKASLNFETPAYEWDARIPSYSDLVPWTRYQYIFSKGTICPLNSGASGREAMILTSEYDQTFEVGAPVLGGPYQPSGASIPIHVENYQSPVRVSPEAPHLLPDFAFVPRGDSPELAITIDIKTPTPALDAELRKVPIRGSNRIVVPLEPFDGCDSQPTASRFIPKPFLPSMP